MMDDTHEATGQAEYQPIELGGASFAVVAALTLLVLVFCG